VAERDGFVPGHTLMALLARLRVALGFVFGVLVLVLAQPTGRSLVIGMSVAACGEAIRIWAAGHLRKSSEVTASGPYRFVAHPLYLGSSVMGAGLAITSASLLVTVLIAFYLVTTMTAAIKSEEAFLRRTFGDQYDLYRAGIEAKRRAGGVASRRRFSLAQVIANREYRAVIGLLVAMLLLALKATYNAVFWRAVGTQVIRPGG
jgi:protein-S-isoprenylcysteine O-methyltransferase Ste14